MNNGSSLRRPIRINSWSYDHDKVYICRFWGIFLEQVTEYVNMIFLKKRAFFNLSSETCLLFGLICQRSSSGHQHLQRGNKVYSVCPRNCMHSLRHCILWVCSALHTVLTRENLSPRKTHCTSDCQHQSASLKCHLQYMAFI